MKTKLLLLALLLLVGSADLLAQNVAVTDNDSYTAANSAMLDVYSLNKGMLVPRLDSTQRVSIVSPAVGLLVFDTTKNSFMYFNGLVWITIPSMNTTAVEGKALFAVKNAAGDTVFAVYNDGVKVTVDDEGSKGKVGGFAVSGRTPTKTGAEVQYFRVTPDSTRIYINDTAGVKGTVGGFAVSGRTPTKLGEFDYLKVTPDSTRVYVNEGFTKGKVGGFAVSGRTPTKTNLYNYFLSTADSTRIYLNDTSLTKGTVGGFAVSGRTPTKADQSKIMDITGKNYFIGKDAGLKNKWGQSNTFMGYEAGRNFFSGNYNVFIGHQAGRNFNSSLYNVFIGYQAGQSFDTLMGTGNNNVALGFKSGFSLTNGYQNTFLGHMSGNDNTSGWNNVMVGSSAGPDNTTGRHNVFIGTFSGFLNKTGNYNVFIGERSGYANTQGGNIFIGYSSGTSNTTGSGNVLIGNNSGYNNIKGIGNIFIGMGAGYNETDSNKLYIDNSSTSSPLIYGDFSSDIININGKLGIGSAVPSEKLEFGGTDAKLYLNSATSNMIVFNSAGVAAPTFNTRSVGTKVVLYPAYSSTRVDYALGVEDWTMWLSIPSSSDRFQFYAGTTQIMRIQGDGKVGIGTSVPTHTLDVRGPVRIVNDPTFYDVWIQGGSATGGDDRNLAILGKDEDSGDQLVINYGNEYANGVEIGGNLIALTVYSSIVGPTYRDLYIDNTGKLGYVVSSGKFKENITDMNNLNWLYELRPVNFNYKNDNTKQLEFGLIAEEVEQINKLLVSYNENGNVETVNYSKLVVPMLKAIQDQQKQIIDLKEKNKEIDKLKAELESIKALLNTKK